MKVSDFNNQNYYNKAILTDRQKYIDSLDIDAKQLAILHAEALPFRDDDETVSAQDLRISFWAVVFFEQILPFVFPATCFLLAPTASLEVLPKAFFLTAGATFLLDLVDRCVNFKTPKPTLDNYHQFASYTPEAFRRWGRGQVIFNVVVGAIGTLAIQYGYLSMPWMPGMALGAKVGLEASHALACRAIKVRDFVVGLAFAP